MNRLIYPAVVSPLTGDLSSAAGNNFTTVTGLNRTPVADGTKDGGEFLVYNVTTHNWEAQQIDGNGNLVFATPNGASGQASLRALTPTDLPVATTSATGAVSPDGTTVTVDSNGKIKAAQQVTLQTNSTANGSQSELNLAAGSGVSLTDNGSGTVSVAVSQITTSQLPPSGYTGSVHLVDGSSHVIGTLTFTNGLLTGWTAGS